jgi:tetratricopeptide (TPR) repeat protein
VAAGRDFELDAVMRASALSEEAALDGLDELLQSGLVVETQPGRYAFDHSLTMEVAYREVGEARHRLLHRRLAEAMENVYRPSRLEGMAGVLAFHFSEGNDPQRAAPYALKAGRQAADLSAWHEAIDFYKMALAGIEGWERYAIWMELGRAYLKSGQGARATEVFRSAADLARARSDRARLDEARLMTAQSLLPQARFAESIEENRKVLEEGLPENAFQAELGWGTALSLEGADLAGAEEHLMRAASFCRGTTNLVVLAQVEFELGSLLAQRGNLPGAVEHYRQALQLTENRETSVAVERRTLVHNNLAYHLLLLEDPEAEAQAQAGMHLAKENGLLGLQTYLYSTLGEIALARKDYAAAEAAFNAGLEIARQLSMPERITGLTANLGLVARELGQTSLAIHRLSTAMAQADSLGILQLSAQIRLWLVPLLPGEEAHAQLAEARAIAASSGRKRLLEEADRMILPNR